MPRVFWHDNPREEVTLLAKRPAVQPDDACFRCFWFAKDDRERLGAERSVHLDQWPYGTSYSWNERGISLAWATWNRRTWMFLVPASL